MVLIPPDFRAQASGSPPCSPHLRQPQAAARSRGPSATLPGQLDGHVAPTWPTAKGRVLLKEKTSWWTPLLRKTSFTIWPRWSSKKESCTGTAGNMGLYRPRMDTVELRGFLADCCHLVAEVHVKEQVSSRDGRRLDSTPHITSTHEPKQCRQHEQPGPFPTASSCSTGGTAQCTRPVICSAQCRRTCFSRRPDAAGIASQNVFQLHTASNRMQPPGWLRLQDTSALLQQ